ncbi:MAG: putative sigma-54 modulation protein [Oceanicoccus sp.]|jgi:putative sigma-54 modulation protein
MQINITGHHLDITESIRKSVNTKLGKMQQHFPNLSSLNVILTVEKNQQIAEVSTHFLGQDFTARASADDLYKAIAEMATKLTSLMQRKKEKVKSHAHQRPEQLEDTTDDGAEDDTEDEGFTESEETIV